MVKRFALALAVVLGAALAAQAANSQREDEEAERLLHSIQQSLREAMPGAIITSSLTAADLRNLDPPSIYSDPEWKAAQRALAQEPKSKQGKRAKRAAEPDDDAEELPEGGDTRERGPPQEDGADGPGCEDGQADGQPPATGLRRWVIRIRNIMFGRRDLEGSEGGEAEGDPESGRTWVESLAHWFAHGIKKILVRISGGEQPVGEPGAEPEPGAEVPSPGREDSTERPWIALPPEPASAPGRKEPNTTPASEDTEAPTPPRVKVPAKVPGKDPTKVPIKDPAKIPAKVPAKAPAKVPTKVPAEIPTKAPAPSDTVYDDEAYGGKDRPTFHETNELS